MILGGQFMSLITPFGCLHLKREGIYRAIQMRLARELDNGLVFIRSCVRAAQASSYIKLLRWDCLSSFIRKVPVEKKLDCCRAGYPHSHFAVDRY